MAILGQFRHAREPTIQIIVETFRNLGEPSSERVRVRPIAGQAYHESYRVWSSVSRRLAAVGQLYLVNVTVVRPMAREPYLRIGLGEDWVPVTRRQAQAFILARNATR